MCVVPLLSGAVLGCPLTTAREEGGTETQALNMAARRPCGAEVCGPRGEARGPSEERGSREAF